MRGCSIRPGCCGSAWGRCCRTRSTGPAPSSASASRVCPASLRDRPRPSVGARHRGHGAALNFAGRHSRASANPDRDRLCAHGRGRPAKSERAMAPWRPASALAWRRNLRPPSRESACRCVADAIEGSGEAGTGWPRWMPSTRPNSSGSLHWAVTGGRARRRSPGRLSPPASPPLDRGCRGRPSQPARNEFQAELKEFQTGLKEIQAQAEGNPSGPNKIQAQAERNPSLD